MMSSPARFEIGASVICRNNSFIGHVKRVVADPVARRLTHLVIGPQQGRADDRLVPISMAHVEGSVVALSCDAEGFADLRPAFQPEFITGSRKESGYGPAETYLWSNYGRRDGSSGLRVSARGFDGSVGHHVRSEQVPVGDVEFRRGCGVIATDGAIGRLHGLINDPATSPITHLLLQHGHLWGQREIAIPVQCVRTMDSDVYLNVAKSDVETLPDVAHDALVPQ